MSKKKGGRIMKKYFYRMGVMIVTALLSLMGAEIRAAEFPNKPIQVLVGWAAGGVD
jgi:tripartite-type tricarboxylate transporter receptor subunit TctC